MSCLGTIRTICTLLALATIPLIAQTPAKQTPPAKPPDPGVVKKLLDNAGQTKTAGANHAAAVDAVQGDGKDAKAKAAAPASDAGDKQVVAVVPNPKGMAQRDKGDPFAVPIKPVVVTTPASRPPGLPGLLVSDVELQGLVKVPGGNVAVIRGPSGNVYFLKANDKIYNGRVVKVTEDALYFEESVTDTFGKVTKRDTAKRLAATPPAPKQ